MLTSYFADGFRWPGHRPSAYERFWPFFMDRHSHPWTRKLHVLATLVGLAGTVVLFPLTFNSFWIVAGGVASYPIAWFSHATFERRKPAAFVNPYWSMLADIDMMVLMALGRLDASPSNPIRRAWHLACELFVLAYVLGFVYLEITDRTSFRGPSLY